MQSSTCSCAIVLALVAAAWWGYVPPAVSGDLHNVQLAERPPGASEPDSITQICEASALFKTCDRSFHISTEDRVQAHIRSCEVVFPSLPLAVRMRLLYALRAGQLPHMLRDDLVQEKPRPGDAPETCVSNRFKTAAELKEERGAYLKLGVAPLQERTVDASEVPSALRHGEVVRFDARSLIPAHLFNVSLSDLAGMHPETSKKLMVYSGDGWKTLAPRCYKWLVYFTAKIPWWGPRSWRAQIARKVIVPLLLKYSCPKPGNSLMELAKKDQQHEVVPFSFFIPQKKYMPLLQKRLRRHLVHFSSLNMRMLPRFAPELDLAKAFGLSDLVERTYSLLWAGVTGGAFHPDFQDNVFIMLSGKAEVIVLPSNCSKLVRPIPFATLQQNALHDPQGSPKGKLRAPWFHVTVRAGEAITIPSMAAHSIIGRESDRIAMNAFFEPRFGKMEWPSAPGNFFVRQNKQIAAMRYLWVVATKHLWDTQKIHLAMHTNQHIFL